MTPLHRPHTWHFQVTAFLVSRRGCVSAAVLSLVVHYYGSKDSVKELALSCRKSYSATKASLFWSLREWKGAADFAVNCRPRAGLTWTLPAWETAAPCAFETTDCHVTPRAGNIADGLLS